MDELSNLKLPELKKECKARGLPVAGNKAELVARLHLAMSAEKPASEDSVLDDALIDEDSVLGGDDSSGSSIEDSSNAIDLSSPTTTVPPASLISSGSPVVVSPQKKPEAVKRLATISPIKVSPQTNGSSSTKKEEDGSPPTKKKITLNREPLPVAASMTESTEKPESKEEEGEKSVVKISAEISAEEKAKLRQQKFGITVAESPATATKDKPSAASDISTVSANPFLDGRLKKRAERFNTTAPTDITSTTVTGVVSLTTEEDIKLAKRKERFGLTSADDSLKKETRASRFGTATTTTTVPITPVSTTDSAPATVVETVEDSNKKKLRAARFGNAS